MTAIDTFLEMALVIIPEDELTELLVEFGYKEKPSVALLYRALEEKGKEFARELSEIAREAAHSPKAKDKLRQSKHISKWENEDMENAEFVLNEDGTISFPELDGSNDGKTTVSSQDALQWFDKIAASLTTLATLGLNFYKVGNTDYSDAYKAKLAEQQALEQAEKTKQYIIIGGIGLVVFVIICFMFYKMFGK